MRKHQEWVRDNCDAPLGKFCGRKDIRTECLQARCCSICPKIDHCPIVCKPLVDEFKIEYEE